MNVIVKDLTWVSNDCILESAVDPGQPTWGGPAPYLNSGNCGADCTECREHYFSNFPNDITYECIDTTHYKFGASCASGLSRDACMTDESYCINSWDINDPDKWNSPLAKCRSVPSAYMIENQADWSFANKTCGNASAGLCEFGCGAGTCRNSWPASDSLRGKSVYAMCRCKY